MIRRLWKKGSGLDERREGRGRLEAGDRPQENLRGVL